MTQTTFSLGIMLTEDVLELRWAPIPIFKRRNNHNPGVVFALSVHSQVMAP
jgi:hypothetical protein